MANKACSMAGMGSDAQSMAGADREALGEARMDSKAPVLEGMGSKARSKAGMGSDAQSMANMGSDAQSMANMGSDAQSMAGVDREALGEARMDSKAPVLEGMGSKARSKAGMGSNAQSMAGMGSDAQSMAGMGEVKDEDGGAGPPSRGDQQGIGCLFLAHRGAGAYKAALYGAQGIDGVQPIGVHDFAEGGFANARFMESYESRHSDHSFTASVADHLGVTMPPLRMDSQVKYGLLSRGEASEKIWDHCAGFVIVEEAGGRVTDASGQRLDFSKGRYLELDRGIIAAPPTVHAALLSAVTAVQKAQSAL
ncbi:hypothetical protein DUNSADRAFT_12183 [Dunaliella salina]|uniref:Uncharacterized protein n=1 Tax=Dunaliella salina TaxID=3046 RepID=A0ABQ7GBT9_DUNSA|nr:hypothetical protein DUNSADRAFT_12183 [Dunaliella salina]|eukprot:KAF5832071.1 hypothetical protein DUNSADRAFT_12183 [Dunaliella salina]